MRIVEGGGPVLPAMRAGGAKVAIECIEQGMAVQHRIAFDSKGLTASRFERGKGLTQLGKPRRHGAGPIDQIAAIA